MRPVYLVVAVLIAAACGDATSPAPLARATHVGQATSDVSITRDNEIIPWVQTVANTCTGEDVQVTGELHLKTQTVTFPDGQIADIFHVNFVNVTGVGLTSGATYRATSAEGTSFQGVPPGPPGGPWRSSHEGSLHLITPGSGANLNLQFVFVVTKEPGSPPNAIVFKIETTCTG